MNKSIISPFWVMVQKEVADHVKSWRFIILMAIIALTCTGSLYTALTNISKATDADNADKSSPPPWKDEDVQEGKFEDIK